MTLPAIEFSGLGTPGNWNDPNNWYGGVVPGVGNTALITNGSDNTVNGTFSANAVMLLNGGIDTFTGTLYTAGVGNCQGVMACDGGVITFAPGATLVDGGVVLAGLDAVGTINATGTSTQATTLTSAQGDMGEEAPGNGTINISDATWTVTTTMVVGDNGTGTLNVFNGSQVSVGTNLAIGMKAGSSGQVTLSSGGNLSVTGAATVGDVGTGTMTVDAGSTLAVKGGLNITAASTLDLLGGAVSVTKSGLMIAAGGTLTGNGTVTMGSSNTWVVDNGVIAANGGTLQVNGGVTGSGSFLIDANSTAAITGADLLTPTLTFNGANATLILAPEVLASSTLNGFTYGDQIEMAGLASVSWNTYANALNLNNSSGTTLAQVHIAGGASDMFAVTQSNGMGTLTLQTGTL